MIELVVFPGNPGKQYAHTRHNFARLLLGIPRELADMNWRGKFHGKYAERIDRLGPCRFLIPNTTMNETGKSVSAATIFFKIDPGDVLIVHDDIEIPFGSFSWRLGGSLGGHNGLRSVRDALGSSDFFRLRLGIGRPERGSVRSWVLGGFTAAENALLPDILEAVSSIFSRFLGNRAAMLTVNEIVSVYP